MKRLLFICPITIPVLLLLSGLFTVVGAQIIECVGPDGGTLFVNTVCPEGYRQEGQVEGTGDGPDTEEKEPYICRFAGILPEGEIVSALTEAQSSLAAAEESDGRDEVRYWQNCLSAVKARETELLARAVEADLAPAGPVACEEGEYEYRGDAVYYTNPKRAACKGFSAVCTFAVRERQYVAPGRVPQVRKRRGDYYTYVTRQHVEFYHYKEKIGKFATVRIGSVDVTGTIISWKCSLR